MNPHRPRVKKIALKINVDTYRGTLRGVPTLVEILRRFDAGATFMFSLGPDRMGRAWRWLSRPGFLAKMSRISAFSHYGFATLFRGTLLPGPDIGRRGADILRATREAGFEAGVQCWDNFEWRHEAAAAAPAWIEQRLRRTCERYEQVFGEPARAIGLAGWQTNPHALRMTQRLGFSHASDTRGTHPFVPVWNGEVVRCPQFPTTLSTLDELIGLDGNTPDNVHERLLALTEAPAPAGHVFTLQAELEGLKLAPVLERLLAGWQAQGYRLVSLADYAADFDLALLPRHEIVYGEIPGHLGLVAKQGDEFLAAWNPPWKEAA